MISYLDGIKGLKINGEFRGNDIVFPHPLHYHVYGSDDNSTANVYRYTGFRMNRSDGGGNSNLVANSIRVTPILIDREVTVYGIHLTNSLASSGVLARFALYRDNGNMYPFQKVAGTDIGDLDVAASGNAGVFDFPAPIHLKEGLYWFARVSNGSVSFSSAADESSVPLLGKSPINNQRNDNLGYNVSFTFGALPEIFPPTYTSMLMPIAAQSPLPGVYFKTKVDIKIERFSEARMFDIAKVNKQNTHSNIKIFSMLQHRKGDLNCYYSNSWNGSTGTRSHPVNVFLGGWMMINETISFNEIRIENTTSTGGALGSVAIYSMKRMIHRRGANITSAYFPDKLVCAMYGFDLSSTGVKAKTVNRTTLKRGLYCVGAITNATITLKSINTGDVPRDAVFYRFTNTYGGFPSVFPKTAEVNPPGLASSVFIALRPS